MTDSDDELKITERNALLHSISSLVDVGRVPPLLGTVLNTALAALGIALYLVTDGWVAFAGAVWAILHLLAIARWVFNL